MTARHLPVMAGEAIDLLGIGPDRIYCDLTVGEGGHAKIILERSSPTGRLIGIDRDGSVLEVARERLSLFSPERFELIHAPFSRLKEEMASRSIGGFHGMLADFGVSSFQIEDPWRGFSFRLEGPLDMRMDRSQSLTAADLLGSIDEAGLAEMLARYGNERRAKKIARAVLRRARRGGVTTTTELARIVRGASGGARSGRVDAATRTFQALRIAVNDELGEIAALMNVAFDLLEAGGVLVCISYHSLEDAIVKKAMVDARARGIASLLTPKPRRPSRIEVAENPRARSARLRAAVKLSQSEARAWMN